MRKVPLGARPTLAGWYAHHDAGHRPPLAREEALRSASELADQAMQMAETKGMGGYLARAQKLLAKIEACTKRP
nr:hypothetical protein [Bacillota bacterium]